MSCHVHRSQKLPHNKRCICWSVVMMQGPGVVAPFVQTFALEVFPQSSWKVAIHCLSWWNKFLMQDAFNGPPPWSCTLPLRQLLLRLRVVPKHPRFITSTEVGWRWSWDRFQLVPWAQCRQQCSIHFDHYIHFCVVLCIVCFVSLCVLYVCKCVLYYCHWVATQLQFNKDIIYISHIHTHTIS
jgi:hypothetical protein